MEPFGLDFGPPGEVKTLIFAATVVKIQGFRVFLKGFKKEAQKVPKGDPREAKMPPRSAPGAPRSGPRGAKTAPGAARSAPGEPQEPPKRRKKRNKKGDHFRLRSPGGPGSPLGATLERFWSVLGASGVAFWSHFRTIFLCLKRSVATARARGVPSEAPAQNAERGPGARPRSLKRMLS